MNCFIFCVYRLAEVGKLAEPKLHEKYETGQFFLHRVFGYRGVILFPWRAKIYDRNNYAASYTESTTESTTNASEIDSTVVATAKAEETSVKSITTKKNVKGTKKTEAPDVDSSTKIDGKKEVSVDVQTYYQVLIDSRDCPHVVYH